MRERMRRVSALFLDEEVELKIRLFRSILVMGGIACLLSMISNIVLRTNLVVALCGGVAFLLLAIAFLITIKLKDCKNLFMGLLLLTNCVLFPLTFLQAGGMNSGAPLWLVFCISLVFIFLEGWRLVVTLLCSLAAVIAVYAVERFLPERVVQIADRRVALNLSCFSILVVGLLIGAIFYFETRVYEKERRLAREREETIRRLGESRNLFFANMSHEIRTPINTIIGLNEMTLRENISDEVAENAINIQNAGKILLALINDILDLSKIESGRMEIVPAQYDAASLFSDLVNIIWIRAHEKRLAFHIDIDENLPSVLYGDEVRIKQVLVNLLTNAVKYTHKGEVSLTVKSERLGSNRVRLRMSVRDTGIGIKREEIDQLFSSFRRVDESKNRNIEGTGLGLAISQQLVELMDGTITVDSIYTKGSVFTVTLDQQIVDGAPLGSMEYAIRQNVKTRPKYDRLFEAPEASVLIVDDNAMNLMVAKKLLRDTRVQVDTAASGRECLQKTMEKRYHVIFMDHLMPEMDGEETLHALRERKEGFCQDSVVIALTANVMSNAAEWYQEKGFDGYLSKPLNGLVFEAVLQKFLPPELIVYRSESEQGSAAERVASMVIRGKEKKKIRVTTDCVCDLSPELLARCDVHRMYYYVTTDEGRFKDMAEITPENLLSYMDRGREVHSGPASVEEYERFFADNLSEADQIVHIAMTSRVSEGYEIARRAAHGFNNVTVLDSGTLSSGLGLIVLAAAHAAQEGAELSEICDLVEKRKEKASTTFLVATSYNLYRNGRISYNAWIFGRILQLRAVLGLSRGRIRLIGLHSGRMDTAVRRYIRSSLRRKKKIDDRVLFITYAGCTVEQLEQIRAEVDRCMHFQNVYTQQASATIAGNCGSGTFGLIYFNR